MGSLPPCLGRGCEKGLGRNTKRGERKRSSSARCRLPETSHISPDDRFGAIKWSLSSGSSLVLRRCAGLARMGWCAAGCRADGTDDIRPRHASHAEITGAATTSKTLARKTEGSRCETHSPRRVAGDSRIRTLRACRRPRLLRRRKGAGPRFPDSVRRRRETTHSGGFRDRCRFLRARRRFHIRRGPG